MTSEHPGTADRSRRSPGRSGRGGRLAPATLGSLLLGSALLVVSCASADLSTSAAEQLRFGVSMAQRGLWSEALFRFERAHQLDPSSFRVLNNLAVAYEANGRFDDALATYRQALAIDPANRELRRNYARFVEFYQSFRPEAAEEEAGAAGTPAAPAAEPAAPPPDAPAAEPAAAGPDGESGAALVGGAGKETAR